MHAINTTPGFIIDSRPYGEAGKILSLFTRDFGLVSAVAQGSRLEKSQLRYFAQDHSLGVYSLVRGREFWRLTSAQSPVGNENDEQTSIMSVRSKLVGRVSLLLKRLLQGEEPHPELFGRVGVLLAFLAENSDLNVDEIQTLESLTVLRILRSLGYVGDDGGLAELADSQELSRDLIKTVAAKRLAMNRHINKALKESHL